MDESLIARERRVANLRVANEKKTAEARSAVLNGLQKMVRSMGKININAVAEASNVSRGFIYSQPDLLAKIQAAGTRSRNTMRSVSRSPNDASLSSRLDTALDTIAEQNKTMSELKAENQSLKQRIENLTAQLFNQENTR